MSTLATTFFAILDKRESSFKWTSLFILTFVCSSFSKAFAYPEELFVIFLSNSEQAVYLELLENHLDQNVHVSQSLTTQNRFKCQRYGKKCFHPQYGLIDPEQLAETEILGKPNKKEGSKNSSRDFKRDFKDDGKALPGFHLDDQVSNKVETGTLNSEFDNTLDCKNEKLFDIYCGQSNSKPIKINQKTGFEIWVDTSTSMRNSDSSLLKQQGCYRKDFAQRLKEKCSGFNLYQYASSKSQVGSLQSLCENHQQNSERNLIRWIETSQVKKLVIITDVDSMSAELSNVIDRAGGTSTGIDDRIVTASQLKSFVDELARSCQNFASKK